MKSTTSHLQQARVRQPVSPWPPSDLERVTQCPVCGSSHRKLLYRRLTDRVFFCAAGTWALYACNSFGSAYLDPRPTPIK